MIFPLFFFGTFTVSFLLPNHYYPWGSFYLEFAAFLTLFVAMTAIAAEKKAVAAPVVFIIFFLFSIIPLVQWAAGLILFYGDAVLFFFYLAAFALAMITSFSFTSRQKRENMVDLVGLTLVLVGTVSVWIAMIQFMQLWSSLWIHNAPPGARPYANLAQPNNYSSLIWVSLFSLYYLFERKRIGLTGLLIAATFLVAGAAMAQSRTSWLVFFVVLCIAALQLALVSNRKWTRLALPVLAAVLFYGFSVFWVEFGRFFYGDYQQTLRAGFTNIRTEMWWAFAQAVIDRPLSGYGWGQGSLAQVAVAELYPPIGLTQYTHNLVLDLFVWNGIPLGVAMLAAVGFLWVRLVLCSQSSQGFYSVCAFSALLTHSLLEYPHAYSYFLLLAGFFVGFSVCSPVDVFRFGSRSGALGKMLVCVDRIMMHPVKLPQWVLLGFTTIFAVALTLSWRDYRVLEEDHRLLRFEVASVGTLKADQKAPDVILFDQLRGFTWVARTKEFDDLTASEVGLLEKIALRYPLPMPLYKLAQLRVSQGRPADAEEPLNLIKQLYGNDTYDYARKGLGGFNEVMGVGSELGLEPFESAD